jgi:anti-anti-sigma factor
MSASPASSASNEPYLSFRRHGEVAVVSVAAAIEDLPSNTIETAAQIVLSPLKENPPSAVIVDLAKVKIFTSEFISFLLRCHVIVKKHHGELVLAGVSDKVRELLRQTALDTLWAIYDSRQQALDSLGGAD